MRDPRADRLDKVAEKTARVAGEAWLFSGFAIAAQQPNVLVSVLDLSTFLGHKIPVSKEECDKKSDEELETMIRDRTIHGLNTIRSEIDKVISKLS